VDELHKADFIEDSNLPRYSAVVGLILPDISKARNAFNFRVKSLRRSFKMSGSLRNDTTEYPRRPESAATPL
jgi:hypothetical protein